MEHSIEEMLKSIISRLDSIENLLKTRSHEEFTIIEHRIKNTIDDDLSDDELIPEEESYESENEFCSDLAEIPASKKKLLTPAEIMKINSEFMNAVKE